MAVIERALVDIYRFHAPQALGALSARRGLRGNVLALLPDTIFELLDAVEAMEGIPPTATVISAVLGIDRRRVSRLVAKAVDAGLLHRNSSGRRLELTVEGRATLAQIHVFRRTRIADATVGWSTRDRSTFAHLLARFVDDLGIFRSSASKR